MKGLAVLGDYKLFLFCYFVSVITFFYSGQTTNFSCFWYFVSVISFFLDWPLYDFVDCPADS